MKPSKIWNENSDIILPVLHKFDMFSNYRLTGSLGRLEDKPGDDIDIYLDADSNATLYDIGCLKQELENILGIEIDIISSNREISLHNESNYYNLFEWNAKNDELA